jgi:hypothetical protein
MDPRYASMLRTTCVATMLNGGHAENALPQLVTATGLTTKGTARYALLLLSDRRLIGGHGSPRRLTEAGWEVLDAVAERGVAP